jgi:opacity protein-like surface antigen
MGRIHFAALVGAALLLPQAGAVAADMPGIPPYVPPPIEVGHDWYLKGYIGMTNQHFDGLSHPLITDAIENDFIFQWLDKGNFDSVPLFGVGIGYQHNENLRFDLTAEWRGKSSFSALDRYQQFEVPPGEPDEDNPLGIGTNEYTGKKSELLFLANGYWDFAPIHGITPYLGAGIGMSYNTISDFRDINTTTSNVAFAPSASVWSLAWALHAGVAIKASENLTIDLGYSYVDLGNAQTGGLQSAINSGCAPNCSAVTFQHLYSHDFKVGLRYAFGGHDSYGPAVVKY